MHNAARKTTLLGCILIHIQTVEEKKIRFLSFLIIGSGFKLNTKIQNFLTYLNSLDEFKSDPGPLFRVKFGSVLICSRFGSRGPGPQAPAPPVSNMRTSYDIIRAKFSYSTMVPVLDGNSKHVAHVKQNRTDLISI